MGKLGQLLDQLPAAMRDGIVRGGVRAGAKVLRDEAERLVPERSGELKKSIRVRVRVLRDVVGGMIVAGGKKSYYALWVEFGTAAHLIAAKSGKALRVLGRLVGKVDHPGATPHPFMRPALDNKANETLRAVAEYIKRRLSRARGLPDIRAEARSVDVEVS
jgi:HK97 gp10 family phage protein